MEEELEKLEGKTYRELTLLCQLPNFRRIYHNTTEQTRTMAAYIYFVLYEQITGLRPSQNRLCCRVQMWNNAVQEVDNWKEATRLARQVERGERRIQQAARRSCQNGRSHPAKQRRKANQPAAAAKPASRGRGGRGRGKKK